MTVPGWLLILILVVLVGCLWLALMRSVIIPALNWLVFDRIDRLMRRLGIPEGETDRPQEEPDEHHHV